MAVASKNELNDETIASFVDAFQEELDTIEAVKARKCIAVKTLSSLHELVLKHGIVAFKDMPQLLFEEYGIVSLEFGDPRPLSASTLRKYRTLLKEIEDFHFTFTFDVNGYGGWYMIYAPRHVAALCKKRHISLMTFMIPLRKVLNDFHLKAYQYYERRINRLPQPYTLTSLKAEYGDIIKETMGSKFKAEKYIRTEQDLVLLEIGDARKGFRKEVYK